MKTCIVCGKNFDENVNGACPCCQFPAIAVLGGAEDELIRFMEDSHYQCPYYRAGDEYSIVRKQM